MLSLKINIANYRFEKNSKWKFENRQIRLLKYEFNLAYIENSLCTKTPVNKVFGMIQNGFSQMKFLVWFKIDFYEQSFW